MTQKSSTRWIIKKDGEAVAAFPSKGLAIAARRRSGGIIDRIRIDRPAEAELYKNLVWKSIR